MKVWEDNYEYCYYIKNLEFKIYGVWSLFEESYEIIRVMFKIYGV